MSETTPRPTPKPVPRPIPRPRPGTAPVTQVTTPVDEAAAARAAAWGRVDGDGNVWLRSDEGERIVGQYAAGGSPEDALSLYVRRYLDLQAHVALLESRVENISPEEATAGLKVLDEQLVEPAVVGDVASLRQRVSAIKERVAVRREEVAAAREEARANAIAERTKLVERAEEIAQSDPSKIHWRNTQEEFSKLFESWKSAQRHGARIDRPTEEGLWQRFSKARTQFDRMRRQHFTELEAQRAEIVAAKNALIKRAEDLSDSTEWGRTSSLFAGLMDEWRALGHVARREDDKLWARFREARDKFFNARSAHDESVNAERAANRDAKLELIAEAEKILPVTDVKAARAALRTIADKWDAIGPVSRHDYDRTEGRLQQIEDAVRDAEAERWRATDPTKKQRSNGMAAQLEQLIADLTEQIAAAEAAGDTKKLKELQSAKEAREAWLAQVQQDL
ncbi:DUF349 domain-containing protein [Arcanobacterium haemolyticum]|nr:DUF349 domain-containing protein [Arcanobacterium haemolyticum]